MKLGNFSSNPFRDHTDREQVKRARFVGGRDRRCDYCAIIRIDGAFIEASVRKGGGA